jgi:hypothetical protein
MCSQMGPAGAHATPHAGAVQTRGIAADETPPAQARTIFREPAHVNGHHGRGIAGAAAAGAMGGRPVAAAQPRRPNACSVAEPNVDLAFERLSPGVACDVALKALEHLLLRGRRGVGAMVRDEDVLPTVERVVPGERLIVEHI